MREVKSPSRVKNTVADKRKRTVKKREEIEPEVIIQHAGSETDLGKVIDRIKELYVKEGHYLVSIKSLKVYVKPEENAAYYVINGKNSGKTDLF